MSRLTGGEDVLAAGFGGALVTASAVPFMRRFRQAMRERRARRIYENGEDEIPGVRIGVTPARDRTALLEREMKGVKSRLDAFETRFDELVAGQEEIMRQNDKLRTGNGGDTYDLPDVMQRVAKALGVWETGTAQRQDRRQDDSKDS